MHLNYEVVMSLNPISLGSNNSNITQNEEITQQSSSTRRNRVSLNILNNIQKVNIETPKVPHSISSELSNPEQQNTIQTLAKTSDIIHEKVIIHDIGQNNEISHLSGEPPVSGGVLIKDLNKQFINESNIQKPQENKTSGNGVKIRNQSTYNEKLGIINDRVKHVTKNEILDIINNKKMTAKKTYQISNNGKLLNNILNLEEEEIDQSRLTYVVNGIIICQEGQFISQNAQIKSHNGTIRDLEYDEVLVMSHKEFSLFITPVLDNLHDTKKVESALESQIDDYKKTIHEFKQENKSALAEDPIMKKLLEAKEDSQVLQKTQEHRKASLQEQQLNLQKEKDLNKKNAKIEERKEELKLYR